MLERRRVTRRNALILAALTTLLAFAPSPASADEAQDGIEFVPFGRNGARYILRPPAIAADVPDAYPAADGHIDVPLDYRIRPACIVGEAVRVAHASGVGQVIPGLLVDWEGVADPGSGRFPSLFKLGVNIQHVDGTSQFVEVNVKANVLDRLKPVYTRADGRVIYAGELSNGPDGFVRLSLGIDVQRGDLLTPQLCDFGPGVAATVSSLVVQSIPVE